MTNLFAVPICHLCGVKTLTTADKVEPGPFTCHTCVAVTKAVADERACIRGWLGQMAGKANAEIKKGVHGAWGRASAFKEAADHLRPPKVKAGLKAKREARK